MPNSLEQPKKKQKHAAAEPVKAVKAANDLLIQTQAKSSKRQGSKQKEVPVEGLAAPAADKPRKGKGAATPAETAPHEGAPSAEAAPLAQAAGDEMDELFGKLKGKAKAKAAMPAAAAPAPTAAAKGATKQPKSKRLEGSKDDIFGTEAAAARNRTEEGYAVYSEAELGLGKAGGNTDKCPFDCDCCF